MSSATLSYATSPRWASSGWSCLAQHDGGADVLPLPPHSAHATKPSAPATCPWPAHLAHDAVLHPTSHRAIGTRVTGWCGRECSTGIARNEDTTRGPREKHCGFRAIRKNGSASASSSRAVPLAASDSNAPARRPRRRRAPRAHAMPGSVVTVQLGQCGNQVRVSPSRGVVLRARSVGCSCGHPWLTRLFPALFPALPLSGWRRVLRHARERGGRRPRDARRDPQRVLSRALPPRRLRCLRRRRRRSDRALGAHRHGAQGCPEHDPSREEDGPMAVRPQGHPRVPVRFRKQLGARVQHLRRAGARRRARPRPSRDGSLRPLRRFPPRPIHGRRHRRRLGAYVARALRDEHPTAPILNHCVWPYESGEVIVQSYNTLLTLSALLDSSDGICVVQNEHLHRACVGALGLERPTFGDMNGVAATQLAGVLLPSATRDAIGGGRGDPGASSRGAASRRDPRVLRTRPRNSLGFDPCPRCRPNPWTSPRSRGRRS